jgi:hypothetical protein
MSHQEGCTKVPYYLHVTEQSTGRDSASQEAGMRQDQAGKQPGLKWRRRKKEEEGQAAFTRGQADTSSSSNTTDQLHLLASEDVHGTAHWRVSLASRMKDTQTTAQDMSRSTLEGTAPDTMYLLYPLDAERQAAAFQLNHLQSVKWTCQSHVIHVQS